MRVVVTGGAGFIGSHIVDALRTASHDVVVVDDLSSGSPGNLSADVELVRHDLAAPDTADLIAGLGAGAIVHAAAQVSVARSTVDPTRDAASNILGSIGVFEGAHAAGVDRIVYVTTGGALYGRPHYLPCDEDHPIEPISPYGLSKWVGERYLAMLAPGAIRSVLRLANVYGPRQSPEGEAGVVSIFVGRMLSGDSIEIHGDGGQTRDFVFVEDVAIAVRRALEAGSDLTLNIGSGTATTIEELFASMRDLTGYGLDPDYVAPRPGDVRDSVLDVERARAALGWTATVPLREGLARTIEWYRHIGG